MITDIHAKYFANELLRKKGFSDESRLTNSLFNASLTLNPHQIDAALFAFKSPLSKGVLLADEVGLGKTIEAGLVMCQLWAERKRKQLVICPASLRKQWNLELLEKFNLESIILETKSYNQLIEEGYKNPFDQNKIIITSYNFASKMCRDIAVVPFDIVVMDEAHKLRNSYRESNRMGQAIKIATEGKKKILLTATPLQNSLMELYGIASLIDDKMFGTAKSFREEYVNGGELSDLKDRLATFCKRTLRKDVSEYVKYTERLPMVQKFKASDDEQELYDRLSEFIQRDNTYAIPYKQKALTTLIIRKVMASSTWAVKQTIKTILDRLIDIKNGVRDTNSELDNLCDDDEKQLIEETIEEYDDDEEPESKDSAIQELDYLDGKINVEKLDGEIKELTQLIELANKILHDTKSEALLEALQVAFKKNEELGANRKALIFTESKRTQEYLRNFLIQNGYSSDKIVIFNGNNSGEQATKIYNDWLEKNKHTGRISASKTADKRNALIEYFRDKAEIMIATESASEGVNLQFCSLVINYDLPWNPQRIEQRIGRCHRYGQKNDVVVVNFINERNQADVRVHELLSEKLNLFNGVFGSSDDVLGSIESGVDFEKRILDIYQKCRTPQEIDESFNALQKELEDQIKKAMKMTREKLFKNFDADVYQRLNISVSEGLDRVSQIFWKLTEHELKDVASFNDKDKTFVLNETVDNNPSGTYRLISRNLDENVGNVYRLSHPLGQYVLHKGESHEENRGRIVFDITHHKGKISQAEQLKGKKGYLKLCKYTIDAFEKEENLLFVGYTEDGEKLDSEQCSKLFDCEGKYYDDNSVNSLIDKKLDEDMSFLKSGTLNRSNQRNLSYMKEEEDRLDKWTEDMIYSLENELSLIKRQIQECNKRLRNSTSAQEHLELQERIRDLEKQKRTKRAKLEENEDQIQEQRDELIDNIRKRMEAKTKTEDIFTIAWEVI